MVYVTIWERDRGRWEAVVGGRIFAARTPGAVYETLLLLDPNIKKASVSIQPALPFPDETPQ